MGQGNLRRPGSKLVQNKPDMAGGASVGPLRQAMVDHYTTSARITVAAYNSSTTRRPPDVADGPAIAQAYQHFLSGVGDLYYLAALDMADATDLVRVRTINDDLDQHIAALGKNNAALQAISSGELSDVARTMPTCAAISGATGSN